jgi:flavorubredoxin
MKAKKITDGVCWVGAEDWDRRLFDALIPLPEGTSYNAYLVVGSEKTALIDTVDPSTTDVMMRHLEGVEELDCIIAHHAEQDHSGAIPVILEKYPEAVVYSTPKGKGYLVDHLHIDPDRITGVADGEILSLGDKTIEFIHAPWVHWPETMLTYLREDRILFTCDLFGSHLASSNLFATDIAKVCEEAKRYYAEVMMPFRLNIRKHMDRIAAYDIDIIAPSHGPVFKDTEAILASYRDWISDDVRNTVVIPYASMHGSTELMVDHLTEALDDRGIHVERFNLTVTDTGKFAMALVDAATMVVGSPTVLLGAHPIVVSAAFLANALRPKLKYASIIGSYGWGGRMVDQIKGVMPNLKVELLEPVLVKGRPRADDLRALDNLADAIAEKHREGVGLKAG